MDIGSFGAGGQIASGVGVSDPFRGLANYIDRILKGAKPEPLSAGGPCTSSSGEPWAVFARVMGIVSPLKRGWTTHAPRCFIRTSIASSPGRSQ